MTGATAGVGFCRDTRPSVCWRDPARTPAGCARTEAVGGELGAVAVFIIENARSSRRGQAGSWQTATMAIGIGAGMGIAGVLSYLFGDNERWSGWWRIAFLLALPLGLVGLQLRREWPRPAVGSLRTTSQVVDHPARELWRRHRVALLRGFCLIAAGSLAFNTFFIFMPNNLISRHGSGLSPTLLGPRRRWLSQEQRLWCSAGCPHRWKRSPGSPRDRVRHAGPPRSCRRSTTRCWRSRLSRRPSGWLCRRRRRSARCRRAPGPPRGWATSRRAPLSMRLSGVPGGRRRHPVCGHGHAPI